MIAFCLDKMLMHAIKKTQNVVECARIFERMEGCLDLVAVEAVYHSTCMANFRLVDLQTPRNAFEK